MKKANKSESKISNVTIHRHHKVDGKTILDHAVVTFQGSNNDQHVAQIHPNRTYCSCKDHEKTGLDCKHILAAAACIIQHDRLTRTVPVNLKAKAVKIRDAARTRAAQSASHDRRRERARKLFSTYVAQITLSRVFC